MRELIFKVSLDVALKKGLLIFTLLDVTEASKCSVSTIKHHFGGLNGLRREIVEYGQTDNISWILKSYEKL